VGNYRCAVALEPLRIAAARLVVPAANLFRWKGEIKVGSADIEGELIADLCVERLIRVGSTGRLSGTVKATSLVAEQGAVIEVEARITPATKPGQRS